MYHATLSPFTNGKKKKKLDEDADFKCLTNVVRLDISTRSRTTHSRYLDFNCLRFLGSLRSSISHDPEQDNAGASHSRSDVADHLDFRREFHLSHSVLANAELQRVWTRSCRCWTSIATHWLWHFGRCLHHTLSFVVYGRSN